MGMGSASSRRAEIARRYDANPEYPPGILDTRTPARAVSLMEGEIMPELLPMTVYLCHVSDFAHRSLYSLQRDPEECPFRLQDECRWPQAPIKCDARKARIVWDDSGYCVGGV